VCVVAGSSVVAIHHIHHVSHVDHGVHHIHVLHGVHAVHHHVHLLWGHLFKVWVLVAWHASQVREVKTLGLSHASASLEDLVGELGELWLKDMLQVAVWDVVEATTECAAVDDVTCCVLKHEVAAEVTRPELVPESDELRELVEQGISLRVCGHSGETLDPRSIAALARRGTPQLQIERRVRVEPKQSSLAMEGALSKSPVVASPFIELVQNGKSVVESALTYEQIINGEDVPAEVVVLDPEGWGTVVHGAGVEVVVSLSEGSIHVDVKSNVVASVGEGAKHGSNCNSE